MCVCVCFDCELGVVVDQTTFPSLLCMDAEKLTLIIINWGLKVCIILFLAFLFFFFFFSPCRSKQRWERETEIRRMGVYLIFHLFWGLEQMLHKSGGSTSDVD